MSDFFIDECTEKLNKIAFEVRGILDTNDKLYTLGTDSKIIGRVFEMLVQPILKEIAGSHDLILEPSKSQTVYPDFVLMENESSTSKMAIDVKSTYVKEDNSSFSFTLGSYASYMRDNTKNISYPYTDFKSHYIIGFIYRRRENIQAQNTYVYDLSERNQVQSPYYDVKYFVQEKYKIAGDKPGSGNTENIGSFKTNDIEAFKNGAGPFNELGEDVYNIYWKYYPKYREVRQGKTYTSLDEFVDWYSKNYNDLDLSILPDKRKAILDRLNKWKKEKTNKA